MHIDNDKLVGTYVSDRYSEKGTVTIVLTDGDSTPTREYTRYKYVQTEQLTAIGVAVKDYGAVLVPETTLELFKNGVLNATDFGVFVRFNDEYYSVSLLQLLATIVTAPVEFEENSFDDYPTVTFNATLPPYSVGNAGQVPTVDENGKVGWEDIPKELPSTSGNEGKVLSVNNEGNGVEWKEASGGLPQFTSADKNKVLAINNNGNGTEWRTMHQVCRIHFTIQSDGTIYMCQVKKNELDADFSMATYDDIDALVREDNLLSTGIYFNFDDNITLTGLILAVQRDNNAIQMSAIGKTGTDSGIEEAYCIYFTWNKSTNKITLNKKLVLSDAKKYALSMDLNPNNQNNILNCRLRNVEGSTALLASGLFNCLKYTASNLDSIAKLTIDSNDYAVLQIIPSQSNGGVPTSVYVNAIRLYTSATNQIEYTQFFLRTPDEISWYKFMITPTSTN